jgi:hypothetical protein
MDRMKEEIVVFYQLFFLPQKKRGLAAFSLSFILKISY